MDDVLLSLSILAIAFGLLGIVAICIWECGYCLFQLRYQVRFSLRTLVIATILAPPALG